MPYILHADKTFLQFVLDTLAMRSLFPISSNRDQFSMEADVSCPASTKVFISSLICDTRVTQVTHTFRRYRQKQQFRFKSYHTT